MVEFGVRFPIGPPMELKNIIVLYHAACRDGFGAAFAAWKKLGDSTSYIPVRYGEMPPQGLEGKEVYIIDFHYSKEMMLELEKKAKRLIVLDHHVSAREAVEAVREHIFDNNRSGAGIAWGYFHPEKPLPRLLAYIQDVDLWLFKLPHSQEISATLDLVKFDFFVWDNLLEEFKDEKLFRESVVRGRVYANYLDYICHTLAKDAELVEFEGRTVFAVNAPSMFRSELGALLQKARPPFAIIWYRKSDKVHFSLRGNKGGDSVDLSAIAAKYGGGGHYDSAGFTLASDAPLPFKILGE